MRKFMAVDGTFLKARFVQTLLLAVGIDGNGQNLLLAWSIVESENKDSWTWFLTFLKTAIPECVGMTLISDRDKGLLAADELVFGDGINRLICCFHLKGNVCRRFGGHRSAAFWAIANAKTQHDYEHQKNDLRQLNASAASYLDGIERAYWVTAFYRGPYYGHKTSNVVESINKVFREDREFSVLNLLNEIWHYAMNKRYEGLAKSMRQIASGEQPVTDYCLLRLQESEQ